jgi:phosphate transport system substrate-binding protein
VEDSLTAGRMTVVTAPEARPVLQRERQAFVGLYPQARIQLVTRSSREAVRALFAAECDLAALSRELADEERAAAVRGGLELEGYRFAKDAVVVFVHPDNPVENLALDELRRIYQGRIRNWSELGGRPLAIEPMFPDPESDMAEFFIQQVMGGEPVETRVVIAESDSETVGAVRQRPAGIGFASVAWAGRGAKALRLSSLTGLPYWSPDLEAVYEGDYPLTRPLSFYVRADGSRLAHGFVTFVTSRDGQKVVHESGLVPTSVPVRFVRRSPMRGAH